MMMIMLLWFPTPYPDELLYSVFARYHVRSGNTSPKITTEELFGTRSIRSVWDLPANLNILLKRLGPFWKPDDLIMKHTLFPYYASFLLPKQAKKVKESMYTSKGSTIHSRIGVNASNVKQKTNLWNCNECIQEDMDTFGETYWHRIHQLPGVFICPKHEKVLEETVVSVKANNQHEYIAALPSIESNKVNLDSIDNIDLTILLSVSHHSKKILEEDVLQSDNNTIRNKYLELLKQKGLASPNGNVKRDRVYKMFSSRITDRCLNLLQSPVTNEDVNWLWRIFQKHRESFHPLRHILVMLFLETDLNHLFGKEEYLPFGKGPWLCLNHTCDKYHKRSVTSLTVTRCYNTKKPVGTFYCKHCGFVFSRKGPDGESTDQYTIGTIKDYGATWKERLKTLVIEGNGLHSIAKEIRADIATVKRYAVELNLDVSWKPPKLKTSSSKQDTEETDALLLVQKERWKELQQIYPEKSKTQLRDMAKGVYAYIYRYDKEWLQVHSPIKKRVKSTYQRIDWELRDNELLKQVKEVVQGWDQEATKPTRITVSAIAKKINKLSLIQKRTDKLPRTMKYMDKVTEDIVEFQKRRVEFLVKKKKENNEPIIDWEIYREAGLRSTVSSEVKRLIAKKVTEYETFKNYNK
jgi:transposase-like protein